MKKQKQNWFESNTGAFTFFATLASFLAILVSIYVMIDQKSVSNKNLELANRQTTSQEQSVQAARNQHINDSISNDQQLRKQDSLARATFHYQDSINREQLFIQRQELLQFQGQFKTAAEQYEFSLEQTRKSDSLRVRLFGYQDSITNLQISLYKKQIDILNEQRDIENRRYLTDSTNFDINTAANLNGVKLGAYPKYISFLFGKKTWIKINLSNKSNRAIDSIMFHYAFVIGNEDTVRTLEKDSILVKSILFVDDDFRFTISYPKKVPFGNCLYFYCDATYNELSTGTIDGKQLIIPLTSYIPARSQKAKRAMDKYLAGSGLEEAYGKYWFK